MFSSILHVAVTHCRCQAVCPGSCEQCSYGDQIVWPMQPLPCAPEEAQSALSTNLVLSWKPPKRINCRFQATIRCPLRPEGPPVDLK